MRVKKNIIVMADVLFLWAMTEMMGKRRKYEY